MQRDTEEAWKHGEYGYGSLSHPSEYRTQDYMGTYFYFHDRNSMLTDTGYINALYYLHKLDVYNNPVYAL